MAPILQGKQDVQSQNRQKALVPQGLEGNFGSFWVPTYTLIY